jgi:hypothetical protein
MKNAPNKTVERNKKTHLMLNIRFSNAKSYILDN